MVPEYSKAAANLSPLVPFYAVDCDADANKALCAQQASALSVAFRSPGTHRVT